MKTPPSTLWSVLFAAALLLLAFAWQAYQQPDLLLDFLNLRYCG